MLIKKSYIIIRPYFGDRHYFDHDMVKINYLTLLKSEYEHCTDNNTVVSSLSFSKK